MRVSNMKNVLEWLEESEKKYSNKISFSGPSSDITFHDLLNNAKKDRNISNK